MKRYYYLNERDEAVGPLSSDQLRDDGVKRDTLVWCQGMADWDEAQRVIPELFGGTSSHGPNNKCAPNVPQGRIYIDFPGETFVDKPVLEVTVNQELVGRYDMRQPIFVNVPAIYPFNMIDVKMTGGLLPMSRCFNKVLQLRQGESVRIRLKYSNFWGKIKFICLPIDQ